MLKYPIKGRNKGKYYEELSEIKRENRQQTAYIREIKRSKTERDKGRML